MNLEHDSIQALKERIGSGALSSEEVEYKLSTAIEAEYEKDRPSMQRINAWEDLLWEIRTEGKMPFVSRVEKDEAFIRAHTRTARAGHSLPVWLKGCAVAAALILAVVISVEFKPLTWMTGESINDGEQYVLRGHEINLEFIQSAIADHQAESRIGTESLEEFIRFLGFEPRMPDMSGLDVRSTFYSASVLETYIKLSANYEVGPEKKKLLFTSTWHTDAEYAWFTLEQNAQGVVEPIACKDVYAYTNAGMPGYAWSEGLAVHMLVGDISRDECRRMVEGLLLSAQEVNPQPVNPVAAALPTGYCKTSDYQEAAAILGYAFVVPDPDTVVAAVAQYEIYIEPGATILSILYKREDGSTVVYHVEHFADPEEARISFQQSSEGAIERISGTDVYFSMNYDKVGFTWTEGLSVYYLGGSIDHDTGREAVRQLIEEMH